VPGWLKQHPPVFFERCLGKSSQAPLLFSPQQKGPPPGSPFLSRSVSRERTTSSQRSFSPFA
jgi:hypothetical protein